MTRTYTIPINRKYFTLGLLVFFPMIMVIGHVILDSYYIFLVGFILTLIIWMLKFFDWLINTDISIRFKDSKDEEE